MPFCHETTLWLAAARSESPCPPQGPAQRVHHRGIMCRSLLISGSVWPLAWGNEEHSQITGRAGFRFLQSVLLCFACCRQFPNKLPTTLRCGRGGGTLGALQDQQSDAARATSRVRLGGVQCHPLVGRQRCPDCGRDEGGAGWPVIPHHGGGRGPFIPCVHDGTFACMAWPGWRVGAGMPNQACWGVG